ncbi:MAG: CoA pyrophosphatase [Pseudomonadota bacterium]
MSALFDQLSNLYEEGHAKDIPDLLTDADLSDGRATPAAVLIGVVDRDIPTVLLTQRPANMRDHPGQVAFPGGKIDPGENAIEAALREAEEELSIARDVPRVIGTSDLYQTGTGFAVTPVLSVLPPDLTIKPNANEVEDWFEVPLATLFNHANWTQHTTMWKGQNRSYLDMHYDGFRIWGVTAAICANLARRIAVEKLRL